VAQHRGRAHRSPPGTDLLDDLNTIVAQYNFYEAWPCKWYVPELDSDSSAMAIEKIEIANEKVERVLR
jgi:phage tail-like protein